MLQAKDAEIGAYLASMTEVVLRASPGPLALGRVGGRWSEVVNDRDRVLASFAREADALLFARALPDLRATASALAETLALHRDDGQGVCAQDGQSVPCRTRQVLTTQLAPRAAAS